MKNLLSLKNIEIYVALIIFTIIMSCIIFGDVSHIQSAQQVELELKSCKITGSKKIYTTQFKKNDRLFICGKVLSEYLPLELDLTLTEKRNDEKIYSETKKINSYNFTIEVPQQLEIGEYEFKIGAGRRQFGTILLVIEE